MALPLRPDIERFPGARRDVGGGTRQVLRILYSTQLDRVGLISISSRAMAV